MQGILTEWCLFLRDCTADVQIRVLNVLFLYLSALNPIEVALLMYKWLKQGVMDQFTGKCDE